MNFKIGLAPSSVRMDVSTRPCKFLSVIRPTKLFCFGVSELGNEVKGILFTFGQKRSCFYVYAYLRLRSTLRHATELSGAAD
jgi:hypothetical protein